VRERHRLREFVSRMLRGIFGPVWMKTTIDWRKLYIEELHD
jgi:hypothetical protein